MVESSRPADRNKTVLICRHPLGVVVAITPWNVPFMVPFEYIAPGLAMGNPVVWKPAEEAVPHTSRYIAAALRYGAMAGWSRNDALRGPGSRGASRP